MNMRDVWVFFVQLVSVACNPILKYRFCSLSDPRCEPTDFASDSNFEFGNISSGVYFYDLSNTIPPLSVSCIYHEPLHWVLSAFEDVRVNAISSSVTSNGSHLLYYYHINFNNAQPGLIRCESYQDSDRAAEIYIAVENQEQIYYMVDKFLKHFFPSAPRIGGQLIVPCFMDHFDQNFDGSDKRLTKLKRDTWITPSVTRDCFSCFPRSEIHATKCTTNCPYGISTALWTDAGRPMGVNKTGNEWRDCVRDAECAFETVTNAPKFQTMECNNDGEVTCSDHFSAISSYPAKCEEDENAYKNFREIQACVVKNSGRELSSEEADYDPRFGFRVKYERDMDAVYVCPPVGSGRAYLTPYDPSRRIEARLLATDNDTSGSLKGILCKVPQKWMEDVNLDMLACSTLFECELQLQTVEAVVYFRDSNEIIRSEPISEISALDYGRIIKNPVPAGIVKCHGSYRFDTGYVWNKQYVFTGLDSKLHFLSDQLPLDVVMSLKKLHTNFNVSNGLEIEVECTVVTFIVFPFFEFFKEYSNGTTSKMEPDLAIKGQSRDKPHFTSRRLRESINDDDSVTAIGCRTPFRNSKEWAEAKLSMDSIRREPEDENLLTSHVAESSSLFYLVAILTIVCGILVVGSVSFGVCGVRKYKKAKKLRRLTLEEINHFLYGNPGLPSDTNNEINIDGIGFPESYQILPMDLKMNMQEVLGEGQFGRCVGGNFRDRKVAVKTTKASMDVDTFQDFLREVKIMAYIEQHENIVQFLGAVVNQLREREMKYFIRYQEKQAKRRFHDVGICLAVVELCPYGDLLSYLRRHDPGRVDKYTNTSNGEPYINVPSTALGTNDLSKFCEQIAAGMEFLGVKRVIHGDLAARNVLVFPDNVVKITDFGLSRKLYTASNYKKSKNTPLPWRWMAIESLKYMEFSPMTDMWSYGVTLWEIFTLGEVPFAGLVYSCEFADELEEGLRLKRPKYAPEEIYQFMMLTWDRIPSGRPSFEDARLFFSQHFF